MKTAQGFMLFGGCLRRHQLFMAVPRQRPEALRVLGPKPVADQLINEAIFLANFSGLTVG